MNDPIKPHAAALEQHCYQAAAHVPAQQASVCALEDAALQALEHYGPDVDPAQAASYRDNPWFQLHLATCYTQASLTRVLQRWHAAGLGQPPGARLFPLAALINPTPLDRPFGSDWQSLQDQCYWGVYAVVGTLLNHDPSVVGAPCSRSRLPDPPLALVDAVTAAYIQGFAAGGDGRLRGVAQRTSI
ncbi:MAG: hypothetical protein EA402_12315 [Planctomycetota bacterium]|nr:MAG: hypothetical protein EA402_12315 [Planctomycetota bacterium]